MFAKLVQHQWVTVVL